MNTGTFLIEENNKLFFDYSFEKLSSKNKEKISEITLDHFDYNTGTFEDIIDYCEFQEYNCLNFYVVGFSDRIYILKEFLLHSIPMLKKINIIKFEESVDNDEINDVYQRGAFAFLSGIYSTYEIPENVLKHIYLEMWDPSVEKFLLHMSINSVIIITDDVNIPLNRLNYLPALILKDKEYLSPMNIEFQETKEDQLLMILENIVGNKEIHLDKLPLNSGSFWRLNKLNAITIDSDSKIYLGAGKNILLGNSQDNYSLLKNSFSLNVSNWNLLYAMTITVLTVIYNLSSQYGKIRLIAPIVRGDYPSTDHARRHPDCIGFIDEQNKMYIYNFIKKRLFAVDKNHLEMLEKLQKLDEMPADENIEDFNRKLNNV